MTPPLKKTGLFFVLSAWLALPAWAEDAESLLQKGDRAVQERDFRKAAEAYESALHGDPANAKAHLMLALSYAKLDKLDQAIEHSRLSLRIRPSYAAHQNLGLIYAGRGDYEKAVENYQKALRIDPSDYSGWYQLGLTQAAGGRFHRAIRCYNLALKNNPRFSEAYLGLGSAYYWSGDKATALDQARILRAMHLDQKARELEEWIQKKEARPKSSARRTTSSSPR